MKLNYDLLDDTWAILARKYEDACDTMKPYLQQVLNSKNKVRVPKDIKKLYDETRYNLGRHLDRLGYRMPPMRYPERYWEWENKCENKPRGAL